MVWLGIAVFGLPWLALAATLLIPRRKRLAVAFLHGMGIVSVIAIPAALVQPWIPHATTFDLQEKLMMPWMSIGVHAGGWTVRTAFEPLADAGWFGHRHATMLSNWPIWIILASVQTVLVGLALGALLHRRDRTGRDRGRYTLAIALIVLALAANAAANIQWPWWGS